jgi:hypothetical protein
MYYYHKCERGLVVRRRDACSGREVVGSTPARRIYFATYIGRPGGGSRLSACQVGALSGSRVSGGRTVGPRCQWARREIWVYDMWVPVSLVGGPHGVRWGQWVGPDCRVGMAGRDGGGPDINQLDTKSEYMTCGSQTHMSSAAIYMLNWHVDIIHRRK